MSLVVFSCEIGAREYIPRIALAIKLAKLGYTSLIGHKFSIANMLAQLPRDVTGLFVHKDANSDAHKYFLNAKKLNLMTAGVDEEMLNMFDSDEHGTIGSTSNIGILDFAIASTKNTKEMFSRSGLSALALGNLRLGLCEILRSNSHASLDLAIGDAVKPQKRRVIVNSPSGFIFSSYPLSNHIEIRSRLNSSTVRHELAKVRQYLELEFLIYEKILEFIDNLAEEVDVTIRAHPSENPEGWRLLLRGSPAQVRLDTSNGSFILEMLKQDLLVGFNCTTHIEAAILGKDSAFLDFGQPVLDSTVVEKLISKVNFYRFIESHGALISRITDQSRFDELFMLPGIFDRWSAFVSSVIPAGRVDASWFLRRFDGLFPSIHPDISRRRGSISEEEVRALFLTLGPAETHNVKAHLLSKDVVVIGY